MNTDMAFEQFRKANPVLDAGSLREESPEASVLLSMINERTGQMSTTHARRGTKSPAPQRPRGWLVAAAAFAIVMIAAGIGLFLANQEDNQIVDDPAPIEDIVPLVEELETALNSGDLTGAVAIISAESNCDLSSSEIETCEQAWDHWMGFGTTWEFSDCFDSTGSVVCDMSLTSEWHALLGFPEFDFGKRVELRLDSDGRLVIDQTTGGLVSFVPTGAQGLEGVFREFFPEIAIHPVGGPEPKTRETALAIVEATRIATDPVEMVNYVQTGLSELVFGAAAPQVCEIVDGGGQDCLDGMSFLREINARVEIDCAAATVEDDTIACELTTTSDIHTALESGPTTSTALIRLGRVWIHELELDLTFSEDAELHDAFMADAASVDGIFNALDRPIFRFDTAGAWLAAAEEFAGSQ